MRWAALAAAAPSTHLLGKDGTGGCSVCSTSMQPLEDGAACSPAALVALACSPAALRVVRQRASSGSCMQHAVWSFARRARKHGGS